jgi:molybdopterin synthase sulfur carrier subunit
LSVTVRIPGPLRPFSQDRSRVILEGPASVEEALRALPSGVRERVLDERGAVRPHVNVFVGRLSIRETGGLSTPLPDGAELFLIPAVSGGADGPPAFDASVARELAAMPELLRAAAGRLGEAGWLVGPPGGGFCLVEQAWHLADLEREGFAPRLRRLLAEDEPFLPDFDGARAARERGYRARTLAAGIEAFASERAANLALLGSVSAAAWSRSGTQEGVGRVTLADVARAMVSHDRAHQAEIDALAPPR